MKQREFLEVRSNVLATYFLGAFLLLLFILSGRELWSHYKSRYLTDDYTNESNIDGISRADAELINSKNALAPEFIINEGDTLGSILEEANIKNNEIAELVAAFSKKFNPRKLNIGTLISLQFSKPAILQSMVVRITNSRKIEVSRNINGEFVALEVAVPLVRHVARLSGSIKNSLISTALELSIPANAIMSMIRAFSYDVDFQRDIKRGDKLDIVVDKYYTEDGKLSHVGDVIYSSLTLSDRKIFIYQFAHSQGQVGYYNEKGESIRKEFLRTPVNAAKISSKFGMRHHPVLGYSRMHKGIDFAAPVGTPILAAGSGIVEAATRFGGYGKYIRIKHNGIFSTAYGHASRFAKGIRPGARVVQGQVIAYVGTTGITNGPHLHYEVLENGHHINPQKFKFASNGEKLTGAILEKFKQAKKRVEKYLTEITENTELASL